jgi:hypothetical protein
VIDQKLSTQLYMAGTEELLDVCLTNKLV